MKVLYFEAGEVVFKEGNQSNCAYLVEEGKLVVSRTVNGEQQIMGFLKEKDVFGEMGVIDDLPRSATVTALEKSTVHVITQESFYAIEKNNPEALMPLLRVLSARIRDSLNF